MKLSTRSTYGLRMCCMIALSDNAVSASKLVKITDLSLKYLDQILLMLKKGGVLEATRGKNGGYKLARSAQDIKIKDILTALNDDFEIAECVKGNCDDIYCPNRKILNTLYEEIDQILNKLTLEKMMEELKCSSNK